MTNSAPGHRALEGGGNAGRCAAGHGHPHPVAIQSEQLAEIGTDGGPDLDDGPLPAHRGARGNAQGRGPGLEQGDPVADVPAAQGKGLHHLRHPGSAYFRD